MRRDAPAEAAGVLEGRNAIKETWQQNLARKLREEAWVVPDSVKTIPHAAMPIITLLTKPPYNVRLDISFEGSGHNGLATNDVVLALIHEFPSLVPMMLVLKTLVIERGHAAPYSGGLSSYALLLMVARYLQEHATNVVDVYGNFSTSTQNTSAQAITDFGIMLLGFLDFYGNHFDPRVTGISVASCCFLRRETAYADSKESMESSMTSGSMPISSSTISATQQSQYKAKTCVSACSYTRPDIVSVRLSSPSSQTYENRLSLQDWPVKDHGVDQTYDSHKFDPIFVEDPLQPSNNVGRNCFRIMQIRRAFAAAHQILVSHSNSYPAYQDPKHLKLVAGVALHPQNLLRLIVGSQALISIKSPIAGEKNCPHLGSQTVCSDAALESDTYKSVAGTASIMGRPYGISQAYRSMQIDSQGQTNNQEVGMTHLGPDIQRDKPAILKLYSSGPKHEYCSTPSIPRRNSQSHPDDSASSRMPYAQSKRRATTVTSRTIGVAGTRQSATSCSPGTPKSEGDFRKNPSRSLSFADVVIGNKDVYRLTNRKKKDALSLTRSSRGWRDDIALAENSNARLETQDDWQIT